MGSGCVEFLGIDATLSRLCVAVAAAAAAKAVCAAWSCCCCCCLLLLLLLLWLLLLRVLFKSFAGPNPGGLITATAGAVAPAAAGVVPAIISANIAAAITCGGGGCGGCVGWDGVAVDSVGVRWDSVGPGLERGRSGMGGSACAWALVPGEGSAICAWWAWSHTLCSGTVPDGPV